MADHAEDGLLRQIDEELRQEHYAKLWSRYGNSIIAGALIIIVSIASYQAWRAYDQKTRQTDSESFAFAHKLLGEDKPSEAASAFRILAEDATKGYALLARFQEAAALAIEDNKHDAANIYRSIASDKGVDQVYRDLATLLRATELVDTANPDELSGELTPLTADSNAWRYGAREILAILAFRQGEKDEARHQFQVLNEDTEAPAGLRSRARDMLSVLGS